ncbi:proximal sequence element A Pbp95 [Musca autumnalis]|uniref:proximal sequence element A Pbp95 n=1 Tax=Musca autumnalis TaxID=221902 RepID=UPI003CFA8E23
MEEIEKSNLELALATNRQLQAQLYVVREKIERLLKNVREIYEGNEELVRGAVMKRKGKKGFGIRGAYLKGGTFYLKGNMFFKDINCRNCPDNSDYQARKEQGEMFPMDLDLKGRHTWSYKDKQSMVEAIKEQAIEHLKTIGTIGNPTEYKGKGLNSEKLAKLLQMVSSDFRIDWDVISKHNLQHRHSIKSCEAIWNVYLHPSLKRSSWTEQENLKLADVAKKYNFQNWSAIASEVGRRSEFQCFVQYQNYIFYMTNGRWGKWSVEEDERLIEVIEKNTLNGQINWSNVMVHFPHRARTTLQCRYSYSINPSISRAPFTPEEDLLLLAAVKEYGAKFAYFPRTLFPNRTTVQLRSRYHNTLVHRHKQQPWTLEDDTKLMEFVTEHGTQSWKQCADLLQNHSRISCRTRFMVIKRFFEKNPNASLADMVRKKKKRLYSYVDTENWTEKLKEFRENPNAPLVKRVVVRQTRERKPKIKKEPKEKVKKKKEPKPKKPKPGPKPQSGPKPKVSRRRKFYVQRLRKNRLILYKSAKYGYNYQLGVDPIMTNNPKYGKLHFVRHALQLKDPEDKKNHRFDDPIPTPLRVRILRALHSKLNKEILIPDGFSLPPSWSTAMAFRALCIHTASPDLETVTAPSVPDDNDHIKLFRERFRTLFYTTGLLSRIHPQMVGIGESLVPQPELQENSLINDNETESSQQITEDESKDCSNKQEDDNVDEDKEPNAKRLKLSPRKKISLVDEILSIKNREIESLET